MPVKFYNAESNYEYRKKKKCRDWINRIIEDNGYKVGDLSIIFSSEAYLLQLNQQYLKHNYHTDVITFDYSDSKVISGDIFIGLKKVEENSKIYGVSTFSEINRVIIHGVLHLLGFDDDDDERRKKMKKMEDEALILWDKQM